MRPKLKIRELYNRFNAPVTDDYCGLRCAPNNPNGVPFCCDICHAVPAAYHQEWEFLQPETEFWHLWRGDECSDNPEEPAELLSETPDTMVLLACQGAARCQRQFRALSCRQFPFFPYNTDDYRFLGLASEWEFEDTCWVINNLDKVTSAYRQEFVQTFDDLFSLWPQEMENYANRSAEMRTHFIELKKRIYILHRNGGTYLLSPGSERLQRLISEI